MKITITTTSSSPQNSKTKLNTISHDKIFKVISTRGLKSRNDNFLVSRTSFNFLLFNFSQKQKTHAQTNSDQTNKPQNKNNPFLDSFFLQYNSKSYFFGIKATKKHFKKANIRNKVKRRIRSILSSYIKAFPISNQQMPSQFSGQFSSQSSDLETQTQNIQTQVQTQNTKHISHYNFVVVIPLPSTLKQNFADLENNLFELLNKPPLNRTPSNFQYNFQHNKANIHTSQKLTNI